MSGYDRSLVMEAATQNAGFRFSAYKYVAMSSQRREREIIWGPNHFPTQAMLKDNIAGGKKTD